MELEIVKTIFSENGIIYWLFVLIILLFIWKWIPALFQTFKEQQKEFLLALEKQQATFENTLNLIKEDILKRMETSEVWHQKHDLKLEELKNLVSKDNKDNNT